MDNLSPVLDTYKKALGSAATMAAYAVLARSMARELLPDELRVAVRWAAALVRVRFGRPEKRRHTIVIRKQFETGYGENHLFESARVYLASKIDPRAMRRLRLRGSYTYNINNSYDGGSGSDRRFTTQLHMEPGTSTTDVFDGVEFTWTSVQDRDGSREDESLELSFDAEHTDAALKRYVPFVVATAEDMGRRDQPLKIYMNQGSSWHGISHHHPATFDTLAMDPELKRSVVADLDRFLKRKDYYRRIGKAWKRGYLLYGPPGTGKSSMVAAMANYLRFSLYDLDLSTVGCNNTLQSLLISMPNKSILVIEDIDCCFDALSREDGEELNEGHDSGAEAPPRQMSRSAMAYAAKSSSSSQGITLSGLLNFIDGLWSTCGEERIIIFTTNYKDRLDPALLRPGRMDMHILMGYCTWEAFKTLAKNYFVVDDHPLFPEIRDLLSAVEATPAEVSEMMLRSEDVEVALPVLIQFLRKRMIMKQTEDREDATS